MPVTKTMRRREFLMASGAGGAAAVAAVAGAKAVSPAKAPALSPSNETSGYRASEHVLKYYKTTEA